MAFAEDFPLLGLFLRVKPEGLNTDFDEFGEDFSSGVLERNAVFVVSFGVVCGGD